jgi:uncharacterized protein YdhG (YjbR/CyaY superfamily)
VKAPPETIDEYIAQFDPPIRDLLQTVRNCIARCAPDAVEKISYGMPTFFQHGNLVHFAAMKHHLGFYPTASGISHFTKELKPYASSKGAVRFPYDQPIPYDLIEKITRFRVTENLEKKKK